MRRSRQCIDGHGCEHSTYIGNSKYDCAIGMYDMAFTEDEMPEHCSELKECLIDERL
jgi:hypothetical protein